MSDIYGQYASDRMSDPSRPVHDPLQQLAVRGDGNVGMHHPETLFDESAGPDVTTDLLGTSEDVHVVAEDVVLRRMSRAEAADPADEWMRRNGYQW